MHSPTPVTPGMSIAVRSGKNLPVRQPKLPQIWPLRRTMSVAAWRFWKNSSIFPSQSYWATM